MTEFKILESCGPVHPARIFVAGATMCGKTRFICSQILHPKAPYETLYIAAYRLNQPAYDSVISSYKARGLPVHTYTGIPEEPIDFDKTKKNCLIIDDLCAEFEKSRYGGHLVRDGSHHDNCTIILVSHWCCGSNEGRKQRMQFDYMVLFSFPADKRAVHGLGCQISPGKVDRFMSLDSDSTSERYRPLIVDLSNEGPYIDKRLRFRCGRWDVIYNNTEDI